MTKDDTTARLPRDWDKALSRMRASAALRLEADRAVALKLTAMPADIRREVVIDAVTETMSTTPRPAPDQSLEEVVAKTEVLRAGNDELEVELIADA